MRAALGSLALVFCASAHAAVGLEIQVDSRPIRQDLSKPVEPSSAVESVRIDGNFLVVESAGRRVILDFASRRKYGVDPAASTYNEGSLYADAGFRSYEILNREVLARALAAAGQAKVADAIPLAEHELAIAHPREPGKIESQTGPDATRFRIGELEVFSFAAKGTALSEADAAGLARYFRYFKGGHPAALRALQDRRIAPAEVVLVSGAFQAVRTTLRLRLIPLGEASAASLQGLRKVPLGPHRALPDDIARTAFRIMESPRGDTARQIENTGRRAEALVKEGKIVPGFLAALEYLLQGGPAQELLRRHRDAFMAAPAVKAIMPALNTAPDKESAEKAVAALQAAREQAGEETGYVLAVFEANHQLALGRGPRAIELFAVALRRNPTLAGAWKDLGDALFRQFDTSAAWLCWDAGRRIDPGFGTFKAIDQFEQRLARELPDYF